MADPITIGIQVVRVGSKVYTAIKWISLLAIIIAIILIIMSVVRVTESNYSSAKLFFGFGLGMLIIFGYTHYRTRKGFVGDVGSRVADAAKLGFSAAKGVANLGIGAAKSIGRKILPESLVGERKDNIKGAYENFDQEINELDFLETEEEVKKEPVKIKKDKKVTFKGADELSGAVKSLVETLNENGELSELQDIIVKNPDEPVEEMLKRLLEHKEKIAEIYQNADPQRKHEIDELIEFTDLKSLLQ
jgi:hypothetical protein